MYVHLLAFEMLGGEEEKKNAIDFTGLFALGFFFFFFVYEQSLIISNLLLIIPQ